MKTIATILVATAIAASAPLAFAAETQNAKGTTHVSHGDAKFIREAAEGNATEIALAKIVASKTQNPQVREYAQMLIRDHEKSNNQLQPLAVENGITWPVSIKKSDARMMDKYETMSGAELDRSVMNHWVKDHKEDIKEYDKAAKHAEDPQVKQFAIATLPTLHKHLNKAEAITSTGVVREPAGSAHHGSSHDNQ